MSARPLDGLLVLEFCQYMAGPVAGLRLADLGARVIKIERPGTGEGCRGLAIKNLFVDGDSLVFHTINRNKESYAADLKDSNDLDRVRSLIRRADALTHNFRPGIMERLGLGYEQVRALNPRLVYGEVTGYGTEGPWAAKPGQDLLIQSMSGLTWLSGDRDDGPTPFGLATADMMCGQHLVQGILAALIQRSRTDEGALVQVSLLESILDVQFEVLTTYLNDGGRLPRRADRGNAHAYLAAPYGIYATSDGYLALAMGSVARLAELLACDALAAYTDPASWFDRRDEIMAVLSDVFKGRTTEAWLARLEPDGVWCADVLTYADLLEHEGYRVLHMDQTVRRPSGAEVHTTRCPVRIDGERLFSPVAAPAVGQNNRYIDRDMERHA